MAEAAKMAQESLEGMHSQSGHGIVSLRAKVAAGTDPASPSTQIERPREKGCGCSWVGSFSMASAPPVEEVRANHAA